MRSLMGGRGGSGCRRRSGRRGRRLAGNEVMFFLVALSDRECALVKLETEFRLGVGWGCVSSWSDRHGV